MKTDQVIRVYKEEEEQQQSGGIPRAACRS